MPQIRVGSKVRVKGNCECSYEPVKDKPVWFDIKDCYHTATAVKHVFRDDKSVWLVNRHSFGRRIHNTDLI